MSRKFYAQSTAERARTVKEKHRGIVKKVILTETDEDGDGISDIGSIYVRLLSDTTRSSSDLVFCKPASYEDTSLPLVNEIVDIIETATGAWWYKRIYSPNLNQSNIVENADDLYQPAVSKTNTQTTKDYSEVSQTQIPKSTTNPNDTKSENKVFTPNQINKLRLYEGDKIIESRFGQSIRFSGYNNQDNEFSPTIILRNRQRNDDFETTQSIEEDINRDGSIIVLSSNKYKMNYQPGTVDSGGESDFKTKPINFKLPQEYTGFDQMLLSSERIILSAKSQEMIFFSKGDYGFISDGKFTIDNGSGGALLDFGDDVNITTDRNNGDFSVNTGTGEIRLNTDEQGNSPSRTGPPDATGQGSLRKEPMVRGETLKELLEELIQVINTMTFSTPAGPTSRGPIPSDKQKLRDISSKLDDIKSTLNFTE